MHKNFFISLIVLLFFIGTGIITYCLHFLPSWNLTLGFIMGFSIFAFSMLVGIIGRKKLMFNIFSFVLSGFALAYFILIWLTYKELEVSILMLLANAGLAFAYTFIYYLIILIPGIRNHRIITAILFTILGIASIPFFLRALMLTWFSTFGLFMVLSISFIWVGIKDKKDKKEAMRHISYAGFASVIVGVIVLLAVSGGDLDIPDFDFGVGGGKKKKNKM